MTTFLIIMLCVGVLLTLLGGMSLFGQMWSTSGADDPRASCAAVVAGVVVFLLAVVALIVRAF